MALLGVKDRFSSVLSTPLISSSDNTSALLNSVGRKMEKIIYLVILEYERVGSNQVLCGFAQRFRPVAISEIYA